MLRRIAVRDTFPSSGAVTTARRHVDWFPLRELRSTGPSRPPTAASPIQRYGISSERETASRQTADISGLRLLCREASGTELGCTPFDFANTPHTNLHLIYRYSTTYTSGTWIGACIMLRPYLMACDAHAPLFWDSEPSPTFAHTPLPSNSTATLSPNSSLQVTFILTLLGWTHKHPGPRSVPLPWYI